jgi:site-specific DNA-cytosine methylase
MEGSDMTYQGLELEDQFSSIQANLASTPEGKFSALGACIFGGGFSFGMEQAGLDVAGHLEHPDAKLGDEVSRQRWPVALAPLEQEDSALSWLGFARQLVEDGHVPDVLYANPPCVAYAGTGSHKGVLDNRMCFIRYCTYNLALTLKPKVWCWELVPGILGKDRGFLDAMAFNAKRQGYRCYGFLTTSRIHGGYQDRRRFHFVASKYEIPWETAYDAEPRHQRASHTLGDALERVAKMRYVKHRELEDDVPIDPSEAQFGPLGVLPNDENTYNGAFTNIMPYCPPGSHLRDVPDELMHAHYRPRGKEWSGTGRPGFAHTRGRLDRPSPNVLGGHTIIHPALDRYLTPRECATIMGFPEDYVFSPGSKAYQEIGRGLCTHNARFLGTAIRMALENNVRAMPCRSNEKGHEDSFMQLVDWRSRGKKLSIKMSADDRRQWMMANHPDVDVDSLSGLA